MSEQIQRWNSAFSLHGAPEGQYVLYAHHALKMAQLEAELDEIENELPPASEHYSSIAERVKLIKDQLAYATETVGAQYERLTTLEQQVARLSAPVTERELMEAMASCPEEGEKMSARLNRILAARTTPPQEQQVAQLSVPVTDAESRRLESDISRMNEHFADPFEDGWGDDEEPSPYYESPKYEDGWVEWIMDEKTCDGDIREAVKDNYRVASIIQRLTEQRDAILAARTTPPQEAEEQP